MSAIPTLHRKQTGLARRLPDTDLLVTFLVWSADSGDPAEIDAAGEESAG